MSPFRIDKSLDYIHSKGGRTLRVEEIMTENPYVLRADDTIRHAAQLFVEKKVAGAPVVDENHTIVGLVGKSNLYRFIADGADFSRPIEDIMTQNIFTVDVDDKVLDIINLAYGRLPVLSNGRLVGIVTRTDILSVYNKILQDLSNELQTVIDSAYNAIISIDNTGTIRTFNSAAQKIFNFSKEDVIGKSYKEFFPNGRLISILEKGQILTGQKYIHNDKNLLCNYAPVFNGNEVVGAIAVSQDMSEIESISNELKHTRELKDEMDAVIEASFDSFFVTDAQGKVLSVNDAYTRITGIKVEDILGRTMYQLVKEGYYDRSATIEVIESKKTVTFTQSIKTGKTMLVTGNPIFNQEGDLVRVLTNGRDITELNKLKQEVEQANELNLLFQRELEKYRNPEDYVVYSDKLKNIFDLVYRLGKVDSIVLIQGESGVGKEIIANELHRSSKRAKKPMIRVNCAAIPESLLESELFGYDPGAFTGAKKEGKMGIFELAHNGTLFLDEIGELPIGLQVKLLRVIQEGEITRVGGTKPIKVDVRLITASNRDLWDMVEKRDFRKDLFYRLKVVPIIVPPLRERKEEIPHLINHFTNLFNQKYGFNKRISPSLSDVLIDYDWPGNIRELKNVIERAIVTSKDDLIKEVKIYDNMIREKADLNSATFTVEHGGVLKETLAQLEKKILAKSISEHGSSRRVAADLGLSQTTVVRKASRYGLALKG